MTNPKKLFLNNRKEQIRHELRMNNEDIKSTQRTEKFEKMSASPYAFYRGSNHLYWEDFYNDWRVSNFGGTSSTLTWVNGDAHIYNYGAYANHHGEAIFCMDDFDDSVIADYQFDLWRMAVSIVLDSRENGIFGKSEIKKGLMAFARGYREELTRMEVMDEETHLTKETAPGILGKFLKKVEKKKSRIKMLDKWTVVDGESRIFDMENPKLSKLTAKDRKMLEDCMKQYLETVDLTGDKDVAHFKIKDMVRRVQSGTGSLGSDRFYVLIEGETAGQDDDIILDVKQQSKAPVYRHMNKVEKEEYDQLFPNDGLRHTQAFKALAEHPDQYLGWFVKEDKSFSVKERSPYKADFPTHKLKSPKELYFMSAIWGKVLSSRHKKASGALNDDKFEMSKAFHEKIRGKEKEFDESVRNLALKYADQVNRDYKTFLGMLSSK